MSRVSSVILEDARLVVAAMRDVLDVLSGKVLLVTGGGGFLCSHFLDVLAALNDGGLAPACRVIVLDNYKSGLPERVRHLEGRPDMRFLHHNVAEAFTPHEAVSWIIHGASIASPPVYRRFPLDTIDVNVTGTRRMLELARRGVEGMLYLSTSEIYGDPDPGSIPTPEDYRGSVSCTGPRACYDESKRLAETLCATYHREYGAPVNVVRLFNVYGPGQRLDDGRVIPDLLSAAIHREPLVLYSDGRATRSFCYVRDAVRGMLYVLLSAPRGEVFNVGNDSEEISIRAVAEIVRDVAGPPPLTVEHRTNPEAHYLTDNPQRRCPDTTKLRRATPWRPEVSVREGLARALASYRQLEESPVP